jgi:hypothetical protein
MRREAGDRYIWSSGHNFGDWLAFATTDPGYPGATTDKDLIQTAYFARSTALLQQTAQILGKTEDASTYAALLEKIQAAFQKEFVTPNGRLSANTQTAYSLALAFDLLPEAQRKGAAERLAQDVRKFGHLTTGFLGTPLLCQVLSDYGYLDEAYMLLNRKEYPSWLYPVTKGATTIWERWDGIKPDGSFQDKGMNSFNHYAYGAIGEWMYRVSAGIDIDPQHPGYKHILIQPRPVCMARSPVRGRSKTANSRFAWKSPPTPQPRCGCPKRNWGRSPKTVHRSKRAPAFPTCCNWKMPLPRSSAPAAMCLNRSISSGGPGKRFQPKPSCGRSGCYRALTF